MPSSPRPTPLILLLLIGTASAEAADLRFAHGLYRDKRYALAADEYKKFLTTTGKPMNPYTRNQLVEYYREDNARLYDHLGRDMGWDR